MTGTSKQLKPTSLFLTTALAFANLAPSQTLQQVSSVPPIGTFWSAQFTNLPPLPFLPNWVPAGTPIYLLSAGGTNLPSYVYDDSAVDYTAAARLRQETALLNSSITYPPGPWDGPFGGSDTNTYPPGPLGENWGPNDLWLDIKHDQDPALVDLFLHGVTTPYCQLLSKTNLTDPAWNPGEINRNSGGPNTIAFTPFKTNANTSFYSAVEGRTIASPTFATGAAGLSKMAENRPLTLKGLHQTQSLSSSPF